MRRLTLTSTTAALALAIGQTAPLPLAAETALQEAQDGTYRTAQADVDTTEPNGDESVLSQAAEEVENAAEAAEAEGEAAAEAAEAEAAQAAQAAEEQAEAEQQAAEAEAQAEADAAAQAEADAAAQAEADAAAQAEADAAAQAEADAAAQAEADAAEAEAEQAAESTAESVEEDAQQLEQALEAEQAEAEAQSEAEATAETEAEAEVQADGSADTAEPTEAEANEPETNEAEAAAQAEAGAETEDASETAEPDATELEQALEAEQAGSEAGAEAEDSADPGDAADAAGQDATELEQALEAEQTDTDTAAGSEEQTGQEQTGEEQTADQAATEQPEPQIDEDPVEQAEAQAQAAAQVEEQAADVAAASDDAEAVNSEEVTLTDENTRSSDEEFETTVGGNAQTEANTQNAPAAGTPVTSDDRDENLRNILTAAAAIGLGAYTIGQVTDDGGTVVSNSGDRVVVERDGRYRIIKDDDALLRRPGSDVRVQTFDDGSTRSTVTAQDGSQTITVRAADGRVLRRTQVYPNGDQVVLFDDTRQVEAVNVQQLSDTRAQEYEYANASEDELRQAILATRDTPTARRFSLNQVRFVDAVRHQVPVIALDTVNFETGSAVIRPEEAKALSVLGNAMRDSISEDPRQVFLIEGHTDTVGPASMNLALSDRRAESVALALTEYFDVPPANMIVQGYGEADLKVRQAGDIRENRRAAVRNITGLLNDS
ncbi:OmpA family protein [Roseovarius sp. THAF8]|uniref:OmpA family protein n=1 Tax=Roseovarius sp. THAF8 TaxID=2587846 RepID=UPI001268EB50|nr:OmpA family protein [Roseovarius sp. THAF8]QFT99563.1 OmpA family protein [Roseovarius sp. THAF8]